MAHGRYPCRRCRTPIDTDHATCPFCDRVDPLGDRRARHAVLTGLALAIGFLAAVAWALSI